MDPDWDFYLYQSPPILKYTSQNWFKSLEESELVPNALLYFSLTDKSKKLKFFNLAALESKIKGFVNVTLIESWDTYENLNWLSKAKSLICLIIYISS